MLLLGFGSLAAQTQSNPTVSLLTLGDCVRIALEQQPALAAQRASLAAAQEGYRGVQDLCVPTFLARDLPIRRKQSCLGITIAYAGLCQAEWETVYAVTRTYFGVVYARQQLRVADDLVNSLRFYQERVRDLVNKGESPKDWTTSTVDKITIYLELADVRRAEALRGIDRAIAALREAMGVGPEMPLDVADQSLPVPNVGANRGQIVALALGRRGELVQVVTAAEVADLEVNAQGKTFRPTAPTFASGADIHARPVPQGISNHEYRPGATGLEMPPNLAGTRSSRIEHARDLSARAAAVVDKTRNLIALEAEDMYYKWEEATRKVPQSDTAEQAGNRLARNTREDFRAAQRVKIEDILTNEALAAQAAAAHNEALYQLVVALADLQRVTAGGFNPGFAAIDCTAGTPSLGATP
ncbi:MAG TPA: TolC family protein [Gemmataceae bacterium]|nr:TolC family protein [Gemmataceae bacterium]